MLDWVIFKNAYRTKLPPNLSTDKVSKVTGSALGSVPYSCDILIIGGGPAGSSAATQLAVDGFSVVLLEKMLFPRNQVGESLIPHFWKFTDALGVSEKIQQEGFIAKTGGITVWEDKIKQIQFSRFGYTRPGLHVERDTFDHILLQHAQSKGALIYNQVAVKRVDFKNQHTPIVYYIDKRDEVNWQGQISCGYVIDASGHSSLLAQQFKSRQNISSALNFLSLWGYFSNSRYVGEDRQSHSADMLEKIKPVTFVSSFADGWLWHIILRNKASVGLVVHTDRTKGMDKEEREQYFLQTCSGVSYVNKLLESAELISGSLQFRPDYSYYSKKICGENYYCIGDSGAFVDPIFSHGVQNAFYNAAVACVSIKASFANEQKRARYSQLCESRMQQFYGFSRALSLGDFGNNGVNKQLVKSLMRAMPALELELMLLASEMTDRSENFRQLAREAGVWDRFNEQRVGQLQLPLESLQL